MSIHLPPIPGYVTGQRLLHFLRRKLAGGRGGNDRSTSGELGLLHWLKHETPFPTSLPEFSALG